MYGDVDGMENALVLFWLRRHAWEQVSSAKLAQASGMVAQNESFRLS